MVRIAPTFTINDQRLPYSNPIYNRVEITQDNFYVRPLITQEVLSPVYYPTPIDNLIVEGDMPMPDYKNPKEKVDMEFPIDLLPPKDIQEIENLEEDETLLETAQLGPEPKTKTAGFGILAIALLVGLYFSTRKKQTTIKATV